MVELQTSTNKKNVITHKNTAGVQLFILFLFIILSLLTGRGHALK